MSATPSNPFPVLPIEVLTLPVPRILWIELSSKCPFDCIFCSRKTLHGNGEFMEMGLYRELIQGLRDPEIIRLNYSGESIHHPDLMEAISLASGAGAFVELVSAFASLPIHHIEPLVRSGLDRLTVSLHTLGARAYDDIYRFSSLNDLQIRLKALRDCQRKLGTRKPVLDFAFVAMDRNLDQISALATYAREMGVRNVFVHPLIRRDEIPMQFPAELNGNRLKSDFLMRLKEEIDRVQSAFDDVRFPVSTHEIDPECGVNGFPNHLPGPLPAHARIFSCDQSPWDSVHVLANGDVVSCEVRDRMPLGNLRTETLTSIWQGEAYRAFRRLYQLGREPNCGECAYKLAYVPGPVADTVTSAHSHAKELVSGWHEGEGQIIWSKRRGRVILEAAGGEFASIRRRYIDVKGLLPPGRDGEANRLDVLVTGERVGSVTNDTDAIRSFSESFPIDANIPAVVPLELVTRFPVCPQEGGSEDVRELGFALQSIELRGQRTARPQRGSLPPRKLLPLLLAWRTARFCCPLVERMQRRIKRPGPWRPGVSVLIPEAGTPEHLERCLTSLLPALAALDERSEIVVSLNGAPLSNYQDLMARFPSARWRHSKKALGFGGAIEAGLKLVQFDWVYLLNSDMQLDEDSLRSVAHWRGEHVFAIASQIYFADKAARREETGWTDFRIAGGEAEIFDALPEQGGLVRGHLYAGGGSSLFRTSLLRRFLPASRRYNPMYFEDAEWGVRAWREGFETLFVPESKVTHTHRATVGKLYAPEEIDRIFRRNQVLFSLRNGFFRDGGRALGALLSGSLDLRSQEEVASVRSALSLLRALLKNATAPHREMDLTRLREKFYLAPMGAPKAASKTRPKVLVVTPYAIHPPAHGGARRLTSLIRHLAIEYDIIVLSDEERLYDWNQVATLRGPAVLHLTGGRSGDSTVENDRIARIETHSHDRLRKEAHRLADVYGADLVQVEFVELAALARAKSHSQPWLLTLHDVLLSEGAYNAADRFEADEVARFDAVAACSREDAALLRHPRVRVVPNGADVPANPWRPSRGSRTILFLGPFRYEPNLSGIVQFLESVYPRLLAEVPGLRIQVLGGEEGISIATRFECFAQRGVEVRSHTNDVPAFLSECALTVNPLSNIRGSSIKLAESLASGRVCVSTEAGARGFRGIHAQSLVLVKEIEDMFEPIRELMLDEERRILQEAPSSALLGELSWENSARIQAQLYDEVLNRPC